MPKGISERARNLRDQIAELSDAHDALWNRTGGSGREKLTERVRADLDALQNRIETLQRELDSESRSATPEQRYSASSAPNHAGLRRTNGSNAMRDPHDRPYLPQR